MQKKSIFILLLLLHQFAYSQSFEHRKFKYDWNDAIPITFKQSDKYHAYGGVILYEETTLDVPLQHIKRYQVYQFNDSAAIEAYNFFRVPIIMDARQSAIGNIYRADTSGFPQLLYEKINFFDARIIRNGEFIKAVLDEFAFRNEERTGESLIPYYIHYFYVRNLEPGDQLEVIISHHWPLFSHKYYINEAIPKQEVIIHVNNSPLEEIYTYSNPQLATFISNEKSIDNTSYRIEFENVEPLDQTVPTPIYNLPRIEFFLNKKYRTSDKIFASQYMDTLKWKDLLYRFVTRIDPGEMRTWEYYDLQSYKTSSFFSKIKNLAGEQVKGVALMDFIQTYAADEMAYKNDFNFFVHKEHGFTDLGNHLEKDSLREASRYEFYYNMLDRIDEPYYKALLQDRRIQVIDTSVLGIMYKDYLAYVILNSDSTPNIFYPKTSRFGYYTNELPFYLTNQFVYLIPQTVPRKIYDYEPDHIQYPLIYIPRYTASANIKRNTSIVNISLTNKNTAVNTNLSLSGQFSTLLRGYYQYGCIDTSITPDYYTDVFKNMKDVKILQDTAVKIFPFYHRFHIMGDNWQNVYSMVDGSYMVDLSKLINIHFQRFTPETFKANYLHDFEGKEEYVIELNFDALVTIDHIEAYTNEVIEDGFIFSSSLVKIADNQYGLKIVWEVLDEITNQDKIMRLYEAQGLIKKFLKLKLKVTPQ